MDRHGIEMMILSLNAPAVQAVARPARAIEIARRANAALAAECAKHSERFRAFAALPLQDPDAAIVELNRCVKDMGFVGALVNGFSQRDDDDALLYYDLPRYRPFWAEVAKLDVLFYLHPRNPLPRDSRIYEGHPWLMGPTWAFAQETAVHALRLMASGLFDDNRNAWVKVPPRYPAKRRLGTYFGENFYLTTSGNFRTQTLIDAMLEIGADRILFSADWPFENIDHAADWFDVATISENDRIKIGRTNTRALFKLGESNR